MQTILVRLPRPPDDDRIALFFSRLCAFSDSQGVTSDKVAFTPANMSIPDTTVKGILKRKLVEYEIVTVSIYEETALETVKKIVRKVLYDTWPEENSIQITEQALGFKWGKLHSLWFVKGSEE